jgi:hypothetical protein
MAGKLGSGVFCLKKYFSIYFHPKKLIKHHKNLHYQAQNTSKTT